MSESSDISSSEETSQSINRIAPNSLEEELKSGVELSNSKIVSAKGTEDGLILRIDGRAPWQEVVRDVEAFLSPKKSFFEKGNVRIEWLDRLPTSEQSASLEDLLKSKYKISIAKKKPTYSRSTKETKISDGLKKTRSNVKNFNPNQKSQVRKDSSSIYDVADNLNSSLVGEALLENSGIDNKNDNSELGYASLNDASSSESYMERMEKILSEDVLYEDDANAKTIFGTIRSGQRVETPFSLIVIGDVNPGADLIAGGDIVVVGNLRGTAHAAAYEEEEAGRVIIALQMRPIQLRIGSVISRGSNELVQGTEVARIDDRRIIVEPYNSRMNLSKRLS